MSKPKTHKGTKKVIKVRTNGTITIHHAGLNHKVGKLSGKVNRHKEKAAQMSKSDYTRLKNVI